MAIDKKTDCSGDYVIEHTHESKMSPINYDNALLEYIETALWSSPDTSESEEEYLDGKYSIDDIDKDTLESLAKELKEFINKYYSLVSKEDKDKGISEFVHNFWLTRNGHGAGFWDGDYKNGEALSSAAEKYGPLYLYVGDDGKIYSER